MSPSVGDVVAVLKAAIDRLDGAAVQAMRAQVDAEEAHRRLASAAHGAGDQRMVRALADTSEGGAKAGKMARLLAEGAEHLANYVNAIAPGAASRSTPTEAAPSGDQLVSDAERRSRKADAVWRKQVKRAEGTEGNLQKVEDGGKKVVEYLKQLSPPGQTSTGTAARPPTPAQERPQVDNPLTAVVMAAGGLAVVARSVWNHAAKKRSGRGRKNDPGETRA